MLDDASLLGRNKILFALENAQKQCDQLSAKINILNKEHDNRVISNVVFIGPKASWLAGLITKAWLDNEISVPFEIIYSRSLPNYVSKSSLVILCDYVGNDNLILKCLNDALGLGSQIAIISSGGKLIEFALSSNIAYTPLIIGLNPTNTIFSEIKALSQLLSNFRLLSEAIIELCLNTTGFLHKECSSWGSDIPTDDNYAKQIALGAVGKTSIFYSGQLSSALSSKFQDSWNNNAKNVAFSSCLSDFGCGQAAGWLSHPVEKPFSIFNIVSCFDGDLELGQYQLVDKLLSGKRPKATDIILKGESLIEQLLWGVALADFSSIYLAALNNIDPTDNSLASKIDKELSI